MKSRWLSWLGLFTILALFCPRAKVLSAGQAEIPVPDAISSVSYAAPFPYLQLSQTDITTWPLAESTFPSPGNASQPPVDPNHILVKFRPGVRPSANHRGTPWTGQASLDSTLAIHRIVTARPVFGLASLAGTSGQHRHSVRAGISRIYRLSLFPGGDVQMAVADFSADPAIEWAEMDYLAQAADTTPNDPLFSGQWGMAKIQAPAAWDVVTGTETIVIAVLDSGLDMTHSDLSGKVWTNPGEIPGNGIDDDSNGHVDDVNGWDFVHDDNDPSDDNGHGTQVAGIAAANTDNGEGMAGVCWNCRIMPVKVMQISGVANYSDIAAGVFYAAEKGAEVINLSLGGYSNSSALREAIEYAVGKDVVVIAGAGNDNVSSPFYPAAYSEVLAVAGTTITDTKANSSDYGNWVDVSAPAEAITSTFSGGGYGPVSGTSFAAPFASGLAGLLRSRYTDWSEALVRAQIYHTTDSIDAQDPDHTGQLGSGRINAHAAVVQTPHPILSLDATKVDDETQGRPIPGEDATLEVTLGNDWLDATGITGTLTTTYPYVTLGRATAFFGDIAAAATGTGNPAYTLTVESGAGYNYAIPFTLEVSANGGAYVTMIPLTITTRSANESVAGTIAQDTVWSNDKTYIVEGNVGIAPGYTLTIEEGTEVRFNGNYSLNVGGTLIADGTAAQPIRFLPHTVGGWGSILFGNSSPDAHVDADYDYLDGSILRHVQMESTSGIFCDNATPYFSHIDLRGGIGIDCTPGTLMVGTLALPETAVVLESLVASAFVTGGVTVHGSARLAGNTLNSDSLVDVSGQAILTTNTVSGPARAGGGSLVQDNTVRSLSVAGPGTVIGNRVTGGVLNVGVASLVLTNSVQGGGITVGDGSEARGNNVERAFGWAIQGTGAITVTDNRLVGNGNGVKASNGLVQENLIANNRGIGLEINGDVAVVSNTFTGNGGSAIRSVSATSVHIPNNNLEGNTGDYDIENQATGVITATGNWWGTMADVEIAQRIFDFYDDWSKGRVVYSPVSTGPIQDAPAYVRAVTLTPQSPVGIQQVAFDIEFSREMDMGHYPQMVFSKVRKDPWAAYTAANSGLPDNNVRAVAVATDGAVWFGTDGGGAAQFGWDTWTVYNTGNSDLPSDDITSIAVAPNGIVWFGTAGGGAARLDGTTWGVYNTTNSDFPGDHVTSIAVAPDGIVWFSTASGAARFDGATWTVYNTTNSGLPHDYLKDVAIDADGGVWFATYSPARFDGTNWTSYISPGNPESVAVASDGTIWFGTDDVGALRFDGTTWTVFNTSNSGLPNNCADVVAADSAGSVWFGFSEQMGGVGVSCFDGIAWTTYRTWDSGLPNNDVFAITSDDDGTVWFGTDGGVGVLWGRAEYPITDNGQWLSSSRWQATYGVNALISRGVYSIAVRSAVGADGIEIAPNSVYTFTVDYAGAIGDATPPEAPIVLACGASSPDTLSAQWTANDPDGVITLYRYAIGTAPGDTDVVNWTETADTSFMRVNLNLNAGQTYYVAVQARNAGGLWSQVGASSGVVAGSGTCPNADFTADPVSGPAVLNVQFTDTSTGTVGTWLWDFGDGATSTVQHPAHIYDTSGIYTVSLRVSGPGGGDLLTKPNYITVTEGIDAPVANFAASPLAGQPPLTTVFTDTSTGAIDTWLWDFGDGTVSTVQDPTHIYTATGIFTVSLTVSGPGGEDSETKTAYIRVSEQSVIANFSADSISGPVPLDVQFTDESIGDITAWLWNFGDGATSILQHPIHTYDATGAYTVSLQVSGPGEDDLVVKQNYIHVYGGWWAYLPLVLRNS